MQDDLGVFFGDIPGNSGHLLCYDVVARLESVIIRSLIAPLSSVEVLFYIPMIGSLLRVKEQRHFKE